MTVSKRPLALKIIAAVLVITTFTAIIPSALAAKVSAFLNPVAYENQDYPEINSFHDEFDENGKEDNVIEENQDISEQYRNTAFERLGQPLDSEKIGQYRRPDVTYELQNLADMGNSLSKHIRPNPMGR